MNILSALFYLLLFYFTACKSANDTATSPETKKDSALVKDTQKTVVTENELLIAKGKFGKINNHTDFVALQKLFGEKNTKDDIEYGAEGIDSFIVTRIYTSTPKEITVGWKKNNFHKQISYAECYQEKSPYYTDDSLMIGSTLEKLLKANGKKITFYGTGWDYGGMITSYNKGKFDTYPIFFQLTELPGMSEKLMGDHELNTDMPVVKANLKRVGISKISLSFDK